MPLDPDGAANQARGRTARDSVKKPTIVGFRSDGLPVGQLAERAADHTEEPVMSTGTIRTRIVGALGGAILLVVFASGAVTDHMGAAAASGPAGALQNRIAFNQQMRKLWEDHITWTRLFIVSAAANLPDESATANRLFQNQVDLGDAFKPFYGDSTGNQLAALLHDHIALAAQIIAAAKAGDSAGVASASAAWYANANQIAQLLNSINPKNWPLDQMQAMMKSHLDLTLQEAVDRLNAKFAADIADYERVHLEILSMADMLSSGIIAQFPEKFAPGQ